MAITILGYQINNARSQSFDVRVTQHSDPHHCHPSITNIEIKLTKEQRRRALLKIYDKRVNPNNSAYTHIFQSFLAKAQCELLDQLTKIKHKRGHTLSQQEVQQYDDEMIKTEQLQQWFSELHVLSSQFIPLDLFVNNPYVHNETFKNPLGHAELSLDNLMNALTTYEEKTLQHLAKLSGQYPTEPNIVSHYQIKIQQHITLFKQELEQFKASAPNRAQIEALMSVQDITIGQRSLGRFIAEQMIFTQDMGIQMAYKLRDNRIFDGMRMPKVIAALSDARTMIDLKYSALIDAELNDTYSSMPKSMLENLTSADIEPDSDESSWFSIRPYVEKWGPIEVDEAICLITDKEYIKPSFQNSFNYWLALMIKIPIRILACLWEIIWSLPRIVMVLGLGLIDIVLSCTFGKYKTLATDLNQMLSKLYESPFFTPYNTLKTQPHAYKTQQLIQDDHQAVLDLCKERESYGYRFFVWFTPRFITQSLYDFFTSIAQAIENLYREFKYLELNHEEESAETFYKKMVIRHTLHKIYTESAAKPKESDTSTCYSELTHCHVMEVPSPFAVFNEVLVVMSNGIVEPAFRKSPLVSSLMFGVASLTFLSYIPVVAATLPAILKPFFAGLQKPTNAIAYAFLNKAIHDPMIAMVACQLEWQLVVTPYEMVDKLYTGDLEIFKSFFEEPEKYVLACIALIATGMFLQFIPILPTSLVPGKNIPNVYFMLLNVFTEESRELMGGLDGPKHLTFLLLGVKFLLLGHSLLNGTHAHELTTMEGLISALGTEEFVDKLTKNGATSEIVEEAIQLQAYFSKYLAKDELVGLKSILINRSDSIKRIYLTLTMESTESPPTDVQPSDYSAENSQSQMKQLELKRQKLLYALEIVSDANNPMFFSDKAKEANRYYDYLDHLFDDYNQALRDAQVSGNPDSNRYFVNKQPYLDVFHSRYCYQGSNTFLRSLLFFIPILWPMAALWRERKRYQAKSQHKPSYAHDVNKSYSKDIAVLIKPIFACFTSIRAAYAAFSYLMIGLLNLALGLAITALYLVYLLYRAPVQGIINPYLVGENAVFEKPLSTMTLFSWFEIIDAYTSPLFSPRPPAFHLIRQLYAQITRRATCNDDISEAFRKIKSQIPSVDEMIRVQNENNTSHHVNLNLFSKGEQGNTTHPLLTRRSSFSGASDAALSF